jgi:hypothetical protein
MHARGGGNAEVDYANQSLCEVYIKSIFVVINIYLTPLARKYRVSSEGRTRFEVEPNQERSTGEWTGAAKRARRGLSRAIRRGNIGLRLFHAASETVPGWLRAITPCAMEPEIRSIDPAPSWL